MERARRSPNPLPPKHTPPPPDISDKEFGFATSLQSALNLVMEVPMTLLVAVLGNKVGIPLLFLGLGGVSVASGFANSFTAVVVTRGAGGIMVR